MQDQFELVLLIRHLDSTVFRMSDLQSVGPSSMPGGYIYQTFFSLISFLFLLEVNKLFFFTNICCTSCKLHVHIIYMMYELYRTREIEVQCICYLSQF